MDLNYDVVLFDKDGTLFDFTASWAAATDAVLDILSDGAPERKAALARAAGFDPVTQTFHSAAVLIAGTVEESAQALVAGGGGDLQTVLRVLLEVTETATMVPVAGLVPTLEHLRAAGLRLGVVTNDNERCARAHLAAAGILDSFACVLGADSGFGGKPDPGPCLAAAEQAGAAAGRCLMVGDSLHDLHAGRAAGMACVGVLTGIAERADLAAAADVVLPSVADLPNWLGLSV